jgi:hypothetical protein
MENVDWGLHPLFIRATGSSPQIHVNDKELGSVDLKLEAEDRMTHYGLRGRVTNVFPVESDRLSKLLLKRPSDNTSGEIVAKIFWQESRESEPDILKTQEGAEDCGGPPKRCEGPRPRDGVVP